MLSNYRLISLFSLISQIFEYVIVYQLFDYMCRNNLLATIEQFSFQTVANAISKPVPITGVV